MGGGGEAEFNLKYSADESLSKNVQNGLYPNLLAHNINELLTLEFWKKKYTNRSKQETSEIREPMEIPKGNIPTF